MTNKICAVYKLIHLFIITHHIFILIIFFKVHVTNCDAHMTFSFFRIVVYHKNTAISRLVMRMTYWDESVYSFFFFVGDSFEDEQKFKILYDTFLVPYRYDLNIMPYFKKMSLNVCMIFQRKVTKNSKMSGWETEMSENEHRWSDDSSCHYMGCSCTPLYDQHRQNSDLFDFSRSADGMAVSTFRPVGGMDNDFRANTGGVEVDRKPTMAECNKCGVEIKAPKIKKISFRAILIEG
jgi:hypothetical protein